MADKTKDATSSLLDLVVPGLGFVSSLFGTESNADIAKHQEELSKYSIDVQNAFNEKQLAQQKMLELQTLAQQGKISDQQFKEQEAELQQRISEANQNYDLAQKNLEQRKYEFGITSGLSGRAQTETERLNAAREEAYKRSLGVGGDMASNYGGQYMTAADTANPYTEDLEKSILSGENKELQAGTSQLGAELEKQGVRGGQAATQMRHGIGEMTQSALDKVTQMKYNDEAQREAEKRAYLMAMAKAGQAAALNAPSF